MLVTLLIEPKLAAEQSVRMSKITNDGLNRSGTGCFSCAHMVAVGVKGLIVQYELIRIGTA